jgi:predicted nucleotidyltransferase
MIEKYALFKALTALIQHPKENSVRFLAKNANIGTATSKRCLDWLFEKELVKRKIIGRNHLYSLNLENILTRHIKILFSLNQIKEAGIVEEVLSRYPAVISIVLYGSAARGEDDPFSDIDILLISRKKIKISSLKAETKLKRETSFLAYTFQEWKEKAKKDKPFYDRVVIEGISLYGEKPVVY